MDSDRTRTTPTGSLPLCSCGHPYGTHYHVNTTGGEGGPCHATVYTQRQMGMNATPCKCAKFTAVKG